MICHHASSACNIILHPHQSWLLRQKMQSLEVLREPEMTLECSSVLAELSPRSCRDQLRVRFISIPCQINASLNTNSSQILDHRKRFQVSQFDTSLFLLTEWNAVLLGDNKCVFSVFLRIFVLTCGIQSQGRYSKSLQVSTKIFVVL